MSPRPYDSPVRRERAAETRARIVAAGSELAHGIGTWDWAALTYRAVAEQAGVGERTVYRHVPTERQLHDAVMHQLHEEAGVDYEAVTAANLTEVAGRVLASLAQFATGSSLPVAPGPTFAAVDQRRRDAVRRVVEELGIDDDTVPAVLDLLWNLPAFEHLVRGWGLEPDRATAVLTHLIELVLGDATR